MCMGSSYLDDIIGNIADSDYCSAVMSGIERRNESATSQDERRENEALRLQADEIPPPPFRTPEKLQPIDSILREYQGEQVPTLRLLAVALARDGIFGREVLAKNSLSGRKGTGVLDQAKLEYIKTLVRTRVPKKSDVEFEYIWSLCRGSLSKCCQGLRSSLKKRKIQFGQENYSHSS